jgi:hypothetical protein
VGNAHPASTSVALLTVVDVEPVDEDDEYDVFVLPEVDGEVIVPAVVWVALELSRFDDEENEVDELDVGAEDDEDEPTVAEVADPPVAEAAELSGEADDESVPEVSVERPDIADDPPASGHWHGPYPVPEGRHACTPVPPPAHGQLT